MNFNLSKKIIPLSLAAILACPSSTNQSYASSSLLNSVAKPYFTYSNIDCNNQESDVHPLYFKIKQFLSKSSKKKRKMFPSKEWEMIALSHISEGLANYSFCHPSQKKEVHQLIEQIVQETTTNLSPYPSPLQITSLSEHGLYLTHLNIILASYQQIAQDKKYLPLQQKVSTYLAQETISDPQKHVRSYKDLPHKWPADQSATLYSIWLFDQQNKTTLSTKPIAEWLNYMDTNATDPKTHLPYSNITGKHNGKIPRGCALSWSIRYISFFAPTQAKQLWSNYKKSHYESGFFISGFREFPTGITRESDSDSGPIVRGIGVAASGFALPASKVMHDRSTYHALENTRTLAETALEYSGQKKQVNPMMATSIDFYTAALPL